MTALLIFTTLFFAVNAFSLQSELHDFMDAEELKFYFGSETEVPDYEIVDLPENLESGRESVVDDDGKEREFDGKYVTFKVFDTQIELNLHPNKNLLSPYAKLNLKTKNETTRIFDDIKPPTFCHYLHTGSNITASISNCDAEKVHGLIFLPKSDTLEILPLSSKLKFIMNLRDYQIETKNGFKIKKIPHLIKRSKFTAEGEFENDFRISSFRERKLQKVTQRAVKYEQPLVEIALFFDEAFYNFFAPFFKNDSQKLLNFILAYMNGVQAIYHHSSLSRKIDFLIVYIELMKEQPTNLPHAYGERNALIDNFCHYQKNLNSESDTNPDHWDMVSLNMFYRSNHSLLYAKPSFETSIHVYTQS